jgi:hypothetical protein
MIDSTYEKDMQLIDIWYELHAAKTEVHAADEGETLRCSWIAELLTGRIRTIRGAEATFRGPDLKTIHW